MIARLLFLNLRTKRREEKRVDLSTTKYLGGIGALLLFITIVPYVSVINFFGIVSLIGVIMLLIAAKGLADFYKEGGIFNNALYGTILAIVGVVAFVGVVVFSLFSLFSSLGFTGIGAGDIASFVSSFTDVSSFASLAFGDIMAFLGGIIIALVVLFIFVVVAAVFFRKSMSLSAKRTGVGLFGTAGMLLLIGAVLTIILIGFILMWISLLLIAIAFFQIPSHAAQASPPPPPPQM
jgi:uncharacterized membrane protein